MQGNNSVSPRVLEHEAQYAAKQKRQQRGADPSPDLSFPLNRKQRRASEARARKRTKTRVNVDIETVTNGRHDLVYVDPDGVTHTYELPEPGRHVGVDFAFE